MNAWNSTTTDASLLRLYVETHSDEAFTELVRRRLGLVHATALRLLDGDRPVAEEVSQSVFIELIRKAETLVRHPALAGWLYTAACRMATDQRRRRTRHQLRECTMALPPEPACESATQWSELRPILDEAMLKLPEADRQVVLLRFFEQQDFPAIGRELDLSPDAARMRVARGLERLRECLASRGLKSTAAVLAGTLTAQTPTPTPVAIHLVQSVAAASLAAAPLAAGGPGMASWFFVHWQLPVLVSTFAVLLTLAARPWDKPAPAPLVLSSTAKPEPTVRIPDGLNYRIVPAGPVRPLSPEAGRSLAKLRSTLFDAGLPPQERDALLKESSGELVGMESAALPLFRESLQSADPGVVARAVEAVGRFGTLAGQLHAELMHVFRTTESAELAGLTGNRLMPGPDLAGDVPDLIQLLRERPVLRPTLVWLIPEAISRTPSELARHRQRIEALQNDDDPDLRATAEKILGELPEPAALEPKLLAQVGAQLRSGDPVKSLNGLRSAQAMESPAPELMEQITILAGTRGEPEVRLAARQILRRFQMDDSIPSEPIGGPSSAAAQFASGTASVPELLLGLGGDLETVNAAAAALGSVAGRYWKSHPGERESALRTLSVLLQDLDPARVEAASSALSHVLPDVPKPYYSMNELQPLFRTMKETLTPGEYAIAMRDLTISLEVTWRASDLGDAPPSPLVPSYLVEVLPVGPMHENLPAYKAMVRAMKAIDPRLRSPQKKKN